MAESSPTARGLTQARISPGRALLLRVLALLALGALAIGMLFFMPGTPTLGRWRELRCAFMDWAHIPFFFAGTLGLYLLWPWRRERPLRRLVETAALAVLVAAAAEIIQPIFGRSGTWVDLLNGTIGVVGAAVIVGHWRRGLRWRLGAMLGVLALATLRLWPVAVEWQARQYQAAQFPVLGDFESTLSLRLWQVQGFDGDAGPSLSLQDGGRHGSQALALSGGDGHWPGLYYLAGDTDWQSYRYLSFHIYNPGAAFDLSYRIDDANKTNIGGSVSRYNGRIDVPSDWSEHQINLRKLPSDGGVCCTRLSAVRRVVLFRAEHIPPFVLDDVHLE